MCIKLGRKQPEDNDTFNQYVNDAIDYRMIPEQPLFYSYNAFGTADAIRFEDNFLRIHDLKTGEAPVTVRQLEVYTALFCLEYEYTPFDIGVELRIYQKAAVLSEKPEPEEILRIMDQIILFDKKIDKIKKEQLWLT